MGHLHKVLCKMDASAAIDPCQDSCIGPSIQTEANLARA